MKDFIENIDWLFIFQVIVVITFAVYTNRLFKFHFSDSDTKDIRTIDSNKTRLRLLNSFLNIFSNEKPFLFYTVTIVFALLTVVGATITILLILGAVKEFEKLLEDKSWWLQIVMWMGLIVFILFIKKEFLEDIKDKFSQ